MTTIDRRSASRRIAQLNILIASQYYRSFILQQLQPHSTLTNFRLTDCIDRLSIIKLRKSESKEKEKNYE
jgi:hypothetical protein